MKIENKEMIINFGALNYEVEKMSAILEITEAEILHELADVDSEFSKLIKKGAAMSDYVINMKIFELAKTGDLAAIKLFEERKSQRQKSAKGNQYFSKWQQSNS